MVGFQLGRWCQLIIELGRSPTISFTHTPVWLRGEAEETMRRVAERVRKR